MTRAESESSEAHDVGPVAPEGWWFVGDQRLGPVRKRPKSKRGGRKTRGKTTVVVGKRGENTLKTVESPKKRGGLQTLGQLHVCSGKYGTFPQPENNLGS